VYEQLRTIERTVDCVGVPLLLQLSDSTLVEVEVEVGVSRLLGNGGALEVVETGTVNSTASLLFFTDVLRTCKETAAALYATCTRCINDL
jgi:hypothetical protein